MARTLENLIGQIGSLPTLPSVLVRVTDLVNNPKTSALQLSRIILDDQALTARLLRLVNSPFYGFPRRIATVTEAVTILGFHPVRNLLMTAAVVDLLSAEETPEFSPAQLWAHAVGTAVAANLLARYTRHEDREELFVAGLLHDVGKLVEFQFCRKEFQAALELACGEDIPVRLAEQRVLGFSHDQVGRALAERWKLPLRLSEAVACHHRPDLAQDAKREAAMVHVADVLSHAVGLGTDKHGGVPPLDTAAWERLRIPVTVIEPLLRELEEQHQEALAILLPSLSRQPGQTERPAPSRIEGLAHVG